MVKEEYILLIPAIIYGVAIVDLLKILRRGIYFELAGWGVFCLLSIVNIWLELYDKLSVISTNNIDFLLIIIQSILFTKMVQVLTPEDNNKDTKEHFLSNIKPIFILLFFLLLVNIVLQVVVFDDQRTSWVRPLAVVLCLIMIFTKQRWVRLVLLGVYLLVMGSLTVGIIQ